MEQGVINYLEKIDVNFSSYIKKQLLMNGK